ncbi:tetratricopeptide repeat protein [Clostridium botulinum]|uniref:DUF6483 family protein n=1 Tax=Clostridium botulinum TaxID=1491 RepID=UPI0013F05576|nr:DUF6483 family protein [Clostridium botulinum]NFG24018.1 tetratricopeptide repeat protein [Clostridium botulinum]NFO05306.1 tetratricopeptide repeat protein [Clostridium botulinum]NFR14944.1 tetratricopeptide repeat protein [Clostridium botulinum]NFR43818.1 tetratricopeptide repeat protein [Clostridium botulinum]NFS50381.1 tetratricopeptide repeat protein [Clostridium botulinum]
MFKNDYMKEMENSLDLIKEEVEKNLINDEIEKAKKAVNSQLKNLVGLDINAIDTLSFNSVREIISKDASYNLGKYIALGELLQLQGKICLKCNDESMMLNYYLKSLESFYEIHDEEELNNDKYIKDIECLINDLREYDIPLDSDIQIFKFYELMNKLDKAEDMLFYIIDKSNNDKSNIEMGLEFYNKLKQRPEEELIKGNLPLEEVEDSYLELSKKLK